MGGGGGGGGGEGGAAYFSYSMLQLQRHYHKGVSKWLEKQSQEVKIPGVHTDLNLIYL